MELSKSDWKLFRSKLPDWQEAYMEKLCTKYSAILSSDSPASERFWMLEQSINRDKRKPGVQLELRKTDVFYDFVRLVADEVITLEDLSEFSPELQEGIRQFANM